ncbi:MAG: hypothetical protein LBT45_01385 [Rickettsiales bacterium]|jgi:hypothetical protein|nr:hypothetical protein [Rickettsiales bacterium]
MRVWKLATICLWCFAAAQTRYLAADMAFDASPVPRCYVFDWSDDFGWQSGGSFSNSNAIAGQSIIAYNRSDAERATGWVSFDDPSVKYFLLCGTDFAFAGTSQQSFKGYQLRFRNYRDGSWKTADDGTFVLTDYSQTTALINYNYQTGQLLVYPNAKMPDKPYQAGAAAQSGGGLAKEVPVNVINAIQDDCRGIDVGKLRKVKNMLVASTVVSGIGAAGAAVATGFNIANAAGNANAGKKAAAEPSGDNQDNAEAEPAAAGNAGAANANQNKFDLGGAAKTANTVASGVGVATGAASAVLSGMSAGEINKIVEQIEKCKSSAGKL